MSNEKTPVQIVYAANNYYMQLLAVSIQSIIETASPEREYEIHILYDFLDEEKIKRIGSMTTENVHIDFYKVERELFDGMPVTPRFPMEIYFRLLIPQIYAENNRAVYIDCDTVLLTDIAELYESDLEGCSLGAVRNASNEFRNTYVTGNLRLKKEEYINSGVLLIDKVKFRQEQIFEKVKEILTRMPELECPDQDAISIVCRGDICFLEDKWNVQWQKLTEENAALVHYNGVYKPWMEPARELSQYFWKCAVKTPFYQDILDLRERQLKERDSVKVVPIEDYQAVLEENQQLKYQAWRLEEVEHSLSYKVGLAVTAIPRKLMSLWKHSVGAQETKECSLFLRVENMWIENDMLMLDCYTGDALEEGEPERFRYSYELKQGKNLISAQAIASGADRIQFGKFSRLNESMLHSYAKIGDWVVTANGRELCCVPAEQEVLEKCEAAYQDELCGLQDAAGERSIEYRNWYFELKQNKQKAIWLVMDRPDRADDNGEAFYRYALAQKNEEVDLYYVIKKESSDYERLISYGGNVVDYRSKEHLKLRLIADYVISSEMSDGLFIDEQIYLRDILNQTRYVFLQHGIINADFSGDDIGKHIRNYAGFVTSAKREYQYMLSKKFFYNENEVWMTGLPRYDHLYDDTKKVITVMPTWRRDLCYFCYDVYTRKDRWLLKDSYEDSSYFRFYNQLMQHQGLIETAREYGYELQFLPHPLFLPYVELFEADSYWNVLHYDVIYRDVFAESALIVTDYSSAVFDFSYLKKPVIYSQFDREAFWVGHTYKKGYFDYEQDGFGEVEETLEGTVDRMIEYMKQGCCLKEQYRERIERFFAYSDRNNAKRVYDRISGQ